MCFKGENKQTKGCTTENMFQYLSLTLVLFSGDGPCGYEV